MTLQQLCYIVTIVNCGSISDAAKQLFITQPSLSSAIKELEKEVGISIFNRSSKDITLSSRGMEFLSCARQVLEQAELPKQHYTNRKPMERICSISIQHYAFAVNAFTNLVSRQGTDEYEFTLKETHTYEIIDDAENYRNELGILCINDFNRKVLEKLFKGNSLTFHPLFRASSHVFISVPHPLSVRKHVTIEDLKSYPFLTFKQGEKDSSCFSEEIFSTMPRKKVVYISDRATLFSFLIGLDGCIICSSVLNRNLNSDSIMAVPPGTEDNMLVGWIAGPRVHLSQFTRRYPEELNRLIGGRPQNKPRAKTPSAGIWICISG